MAARILLLGDSLTRGEESNSTSYRSYRGTLQSRLSAAGIAFDMVGPIQSTPAAGGSDPDVAAWGGACIDATGNGSNNLTDRLASLKADFPSLDLLVIYVGWNDVYQSPANIASRYATFISTVQSGAWASVPAVLCTLHPQRGETEAQTGASLPGYAALNAQIRSMAASNRVIADLASRTGASASAWVEGMIYDAQHAPDFSTIAGGATVPADRGGHLITSFKSIVDFCANWSQNPPAAYNAPGGMGLAGPQSAGPGHPRFRDNVAGCTPWFWCFALDGDTSNNTCIEVRNMYAGAKRIGAGYQYFFSGARTGSWNDANIWVPGGGQRSNLIQMGHRSDGITSYYKPQGSTGIEVWPVDTQPSRGIVHFNGGFNRDLFANSEMFFFGVQARLALIDPNGPNDIANARFGVACGADYFTPLGGSHYDWIGWPYNACDGGHDRWKRLSQTEWTPVTSLTLGSGSDGHWQDPGTPPPLANWYPETPFNNIANGYSLTAAQVRANPPPLPQYWSGTEAGYSAADYWDVIHLYQSGADKVAETIANTIITSGLLAPATGGGVGNYVPAIPGGYAVTSTEYQRLYGPGKTQAFTSLTSFAGVGNTQTGVETRLSMRLRSPVTGTIKQIRYYSPGGPGSTDGSYAKGNGGVMRVTALPDDGTSNHRPNMSGTAYARGTHTPGMTAGAYGTSGGQFPVVTMNEVTKVSISAGTIFHLVFQDPNLSASHWSGVNVRTSTKSQGTAERWLSPIDSGVLLMQGSPGFSGVGTVSETTMTAYDTGKPDGGYYTSPIVEIEMDDGSIWGCSDMETAAYAPPHWSRTAGQKVVERYVPTANRSISGVSIRCAASAPGSLEWRLINTSNSAVLASGTVTQSVADFSSVAAFGDSFMADRLPWRDFAFNSLAALASGGTYDLEMNPVSGTWVFGNRRNGGDWGFRAKAAFLESQAYQWNGSTLLKAYRSDGGEVDGSNWDVVLHLASSNAGDPVIPGYVLPGLPTSPHWTNKLTGSDKTWGFKNFGPGGDGNTAVAPAWITSSMPVAKIGTAYSGGLSASGNPAPTFSHVSGKPSWLSVNSTTGELTGTPTGSETTHTITWRATNTEGTADVTLPLQVTSGVNITTTSLPAAVANAAYSQLLQADGVAPFRWSITSGALPVGLTMTDGGSIYGTPTATSGTASFTVQAIDATGQTDTQSLSIAAVPATADPTITTSALPVGTVGSAYSTTTFSSTGGTTPKTWSIDGLPPGMSFTSGGVLSGTPTLAGAFQLSVTLTDSASRSQTRGYVLTINPAGAAVSSPWASKVAGL